MSYDVDTQVPIPARGAKVQGERLYTAAIGYWAARECHGQGSDEEVEALANFMEVSRLAFIAKCPRLNDDPENPGNPGEPMIPDVDPVERPCGLPGVHFAKLMAFIGFEKSSLGG